MSSLGLGTLGGVFLAAALAAGIWVDPLGDWRLFQVLFVVMAGCTAVVAWLVWSGRRLSVGGRGVLLTVGILAQVGFLFQAPSDDIYRYLWEGRVQLAGENPYAVAPADPMVKHLRTEQDELINHPEWTAIYGPLAQAGFAVVAVIAPSITGWKVTVLVGQIVLLCTVFVLLRQARASLDWLVVCAWHPLLLWQLPGQGHLEGWLAVFVVGAVWALTMSGSGRRHIAIAGLCLAAAVLIKPTAGLFVLLFAAPGFTWRQRVGGASVLLITVLAAYAPYWLGWPFRSGANVFISLFRFGGSMQFNDFFSLFVGSSEDTRMFRLLLSMIGCGAMAVAMWRKPWSPAFGAMVLAAGGLLLLPTVHPWYGTLCIPLLVVSTATANSSQVDGSPVVDAVLAATWMLSFTLLAAGETRAVFHDTGVWREAWWPRWLVYGPVTFTLAMVLIPWTSLKRRKSAKNVASRTPLEGI